MSVGSCNSSARLPLVVASHPITASRGTGSTEFCCGGAQVYVLDGSYTVGEPPFAGIEPISPPDKDKPKRQLIFRREGSRMTRAGCVFALIVTEAAPTPCSRIGFHISNISVYVPGETRIKSPGVAASIAS